MAKSAAQPLVSIITPSFNQGEFLQACIESVLAQDYANIEYILVDGASNDNSLEIIKRNKDAFAWWTSEKDAGQAEAINKGLRRAKGEFVAWLNSDDLYQPHAVSIAVKALQQHPEAAFIYGDLESLRRDGSPFHTIRYQQYSLSDLLAFRMIGQPSVFMRHDLLKEAGFLDESYHYLLDHQLWLRLAQHGSIHYLPQTLAAARHHSSAKNRAQGGKFGQEAFRILDWAAQDAQLAPQLKAYSRRSRAGAHRLQARYSLEAGAAAASIASYLRAFALNLGEFFRHWKRFIWAILSALGLGWIRPEPYESRRPILVTGVHRSGTSWLGRMLNLSQRTVYISEPLNKLHRKGVFNTEVDFWYQYIHSGNGDRFLPALSETLKLRYKLGREILSLRSDRDLLRMLRDSFVFLRGRLARQRPLIKDPFAIFSVPWIIENLHTDVVIIVRHPAAAVSSLKRLDWHFDLRDLLAQEELMQAWLSPFRQEIEALVAKEGATVVEQGALLWRMIYSVAHQLKERYPQIHLLRHEDLSREPLKEFEQLYLDLELPFTQHAQQGIRKATQARNPKEVSKRSIYSTRLDSLANLFNWKQRLEPDEVNLIREITQDVAALYYSSEDWDQ